MAITFVGNCVIPTEWIELPLLRVTPYNHDTSIFSFGFTSPHSSLNISTCGCLLLLAPDCEHGGGDAVRPYTPISSNSSTVGYFDLLIKRYDQWGQKCEQETIFSYFSYNITQHSYKPRGAVSNYLFERKIGDLVKFKHIPQNLKIQYPFCSVRSITMIAVGVGIAPMIQAFHELFRVNSDGTPQDNTEVCLLYGVRTVADILLKEQIEEWANLFPHRFRVVYCVGSRWAGVHMAAKRQEEYIPPSLPLGYEDLSTTLNSLHQEGKSQSISCELGWINEEKIAKHGYPPAADTRVFVCGLPGVYLKLCGPRTTSTIPPNTALHDLGYREEMVVKF